MFTPIVVYAVKDTIYVVTIEIVYICFPVEVSSLNTLVYRSYIDPSIAPRRAPLLDTYIWTSMFCSYYTLDQESNTYVSSNPSTLSKAADLENFTMSLILIILWQLWCKVWSVDNAKISMFPWGKVWEEFAVYRMLPISKWHAVDIWWSMPSDIRLHSL